MSNRRGIRLALEVAYLAALAAALAFTSLSAPVIVAAMLLGWLLVTGAEWSAARERPHFASGLPPRWYVPALPLPPAQPLEQVLPAYPEASYDEGATWIASAALREELLGEWPVAVPSGEAEPEDTQEAYPEDWIVPLPAREPELVEPAPEPEAEPEPVAALPEPEPEPVAVLPEPEPVAVLPELEPVAVLPAPEPEPDETLDHALGQRVARYHVDPFAEPEKRRFGRRSEVPALQVPARPAGPRALPGSASEGSG